MSAAAPMSAAELARAKMAGQVERVKAAAGAEEVAEVKKERWSPFKAFVAWWRKKKYENEKRMLRNEEQMKGDLERFLMEIEEQHTWVESELNYRNFQRLKKEEVIERAKRKEAERLVEEDQALNTEQGLCYHLGKVEKFRVWQNSPAKFQDIPGHAGPIYSVKLSPCLQYALSCSADMTARLWHLAEGKTKYPLLTYEGHTKKVIDGDIHPLTFKMDDQAPHIITCSGDGTIKCWGTRSERAMKTVEAHTEAVYKAVFSRDGKRVASASEDMIVKTWCYPEMFCLYIYEGHRSAVTSLSFSPTCRYLVSGSDYGERKIFLWDSQMPRFSTPLQYPHMLFWTTEGLITKIILRQYTPSETFWMTGDQMQYLGEDAAYEVWTGELEDIEVPSDSDDDEEDDGEEAVDPTTKDDVPEINGCTLSLVYTDKTGKRTVPTEYIPGGLLTVVVQSQDIPIAEAFIDVLAVKSQFDMFSPNAGERLGTFIVNHPTPWEMDSPDVIIDPLGWRKPRRPESMIPQGVQAVATAVPPEPPVGSPGSPDSPTSIKEKPKAPSTLFIPGNEGQGIVFRNQFETRAKEPVEGIEYVEGETEDVPLRPSKFELTWFCPSPDKGPAVFKMNFRFHNVEKWETIKVTLKESPMRIKTGKGQEMEAVQIFNFDQEARHTEFFRFVRLKNWDAVSQFLDKKCVLYKEKALRKRRWRCVDTLEDVFGHHRGFIMPAPIIFKGGLTKSTIMMEACPLWHVNKSDSDDEEDDDDGDDDEDEEGEGEGDEKRGGGDDEEEGGKADGEGEASIGEAKTDAETSSQLTDKSGELPTVLEEAGSEAEAEGSEAEGSVGSGRTPPASPNASQPTSPLSSQPPAEQVTPAASPRPGAPDTDGSSSPRQASSITPVASPRLDPAKSPPTSDRADEAGGRTVRFNPEVQVEVIQELTESAEEAGAAEASGTGIALSSVQLALNASHSRVRADGPMGLFGRARPKDDLQDDEFGERHKAGHLNLPEFVFAGEVAGKHFQSDVLRLARKETNFVVLMKTSGVAAAKEIRMYSTDPAKQDQLALIPSAPAWVRSNFLKHRTAIPDRKRPVHGYYDLKTSPLLKSDIFGPNIQKFSMPLPVNYPRRAGAALSAFRLQLGPYEATRRKIEDEAIGSSGTLGAIDEEEEVGGVQAELKKFRAGLRELENAIKGQVALHLVAERAYQGTRRNALGELPGMQNHYPNPFYTEPAEDMAYLVEMEEEEAPFFAFLWGKKHVLSRKVPPVGRRPKPRVFVDDETPSGKGEGEEGEGEGEGEGEEKQGGDEAAGHAHRPGSSSSARPDSSGSQDSALSADHGHGHGHEHGHGHGHKHEHRPSSSESHDSSGGRGGGAHGTHGASSETKEEGEEDKGLGGQIDAAADSEAAAAAAAATAADLEAEARKREYNRRKRLGIPQDVYLQRRGSFPFSPGLEPFANGVKDPVRRLHDDSAHSSPAHGHRKHGHHHKKPTQKFIPNDEIDVLATGGLLRIFVNQTGHEFAHNGAVNDVKFAPSETRVASAGGDSTVKIWDPRDGTLVRVLNGHRGAVTSLAYSSDELYLVSGSEDQEILVWDMTTNSVFKRLRGHRDVVTSVSISPDCTLLVSSSYDRFVKTWYMTPRPPGAPEPPRVISKTDVTALIAWSPPPSFNIEITAFHIQSRIGLRGDWFPPEEPGQRPFTVMPTKRSAIVKGLAANTLYQFRIRAENMMGIGAWSQPSKLTATALGFPGEVEIPKICGCTTTSLTIYWFTKAPATYAGASRQFEVSRAGEGKGWADHPLFPMTLDEGVAKGLKVLQYFRGKLEVKKVKIVQRKEKHLQDKEEDMGFQIANEFMQDILDQSANDETHLFVACEVTGLRPGFQYRFRVRGVNEAGPGPWSPASYSIYSLPIPPNAPTRPFIDSRTMTSIRFAWHAPDGNGSAITNYVIYIKHLDKEYSVPRSQLHFDIEHLLPGRAYFLRVKALNSVGSSEWSDWNENSWANAQTLTDKPEQPRNPLSVHGTFDSMTVDVRLPYDNGAALTHMMIMQRWVKPFDKGEWHAPRTFSLLPEDDSHPHVEVIEDVDPDALLKQLLEQQRLEEEERKAGYNPLKKGKAGINIAAILSAAKPEGSLVRVVLDRLESDFVYEFRVNVRNAAGTSLFSNPSHRAKTNKARVPGEPSEFFLMEVTPTEVTFRADWATQGGAHIDRYLAEMLRKGATADSDKTYRITWDRPPPFTAPHTPVVLSITDHLVPGKFYQWRICAENAIGSGPWCEWTEEVLIPSPESDILEHDAQIDAEAEMSDEPDSDLEDFEKDVIQTNTGLSEGRDQRAARGGAGGGGGDMGIKAPPPTKRMPKI